MWQRTLSLLILATTCSACSWESAKRTTYETVESLRVQQCLDRRDDPDCPTERQRYESYDAQQPRDARE